MRISLFSLLTRNISFFLPFLLIGLGGLVFISLGCQQSIQTQQAEASSTDPPSTPQTPEALLQSFSMQIQESPRDYALYESRSQVYYELDSLEKAVEDIEQAIELYQNGPSLHYWRGFLAFVENDTAKAMTEYKTAIGLGSNNPEVYYQIGQLFFLQKKYDAALGNYQQAAKVAPKDPQYIFAQGFLEESRRRHSQAVPLYISALEIDSTFDKALSRLHDVYFQHYENEEEAMKYNEQLLRNIPTHPLGQFNLGSFHLRKAIAILNQAELPIFKERVNDAVVAFTIAVNKDPSFSQAWYNRGYCYWLGDGQENRAIEDFQKVIELDSTHASAHFMLGSIFEKNGDLQTALGHYEQAVAFNPGSNDFQTAAQEVRAKLGG